MKNYLATGLALVGLAAAAVPALAFGHHQAACAPEAAPCAPQLAVTWVEKTVNDFKIEWQERKIETVVDTVEYQEVPRTEKRVVQQLQFLESRDVRTVMRLVPHPTVKEVTTFRFLPEQSCLAPCEGGHCGKDGCAAGLCGAVGCHISWSLVPVEDQIPATAYELRPVQEEIVVTQPVIKLVEIPYTVLEAKAVPKKLKIVKVERVPVTVPYCRTVRIPVYTPQCGVVGPVVEERSLPPKVEERPEERRTPQ